MFNVVAVVTDMIFVFVHIGKALDVVVAVRVVIVNAVVVGIDISVVIFDVVIVIVNAVVILDVVANVNS